MAKLLGTTPNLSKKIIGEYIAKPKNRDTLQEFVHLFNFHGVSSQFLGDKNDQYF